MRAKRAKQLARETHKVKADLEAQGGKEHPYKWVKKQVKKAYYRSK